MKKHIRVKVSLDDKDWAEARSVISQVVGGQVGSRFRNRLIEIVRGCIDCTVVVHRKTAFGAERHVRLSFLLDKFREDIAVAAKQLHV